MTKTVSVIKRDGNLVNVHGMHINSTVFEVARAMVRLHQRADIPEFLTAKLLVKEMLANSDYPKLNSQVNKRVSKSGTLLTIAKKAIQSAMYQLSLKELLLKYEANSYKINLSKELRVDNKVVTLKEYVNSLETITTNVTPKIFPRQSSFLKGDEINYPATNDRAARIERILTPLINTDETYLLSYSYNAINNTITTCSKLKEKK